MSLVCIPRREDFFPTTKRGHGSTRPARIVVKVKEGEFLTLEPKPCAETTCVLNMPKSTNLHIGQDTNLRDWCEEHRLSVRSKDRPNARFEDPGMAMRVATGGRA